MGFRALAMIALGAGATLSAAMAAPPSGECSQTSTFTETFAAGSNEGGWTFGFGGEFIEDQRGRNKEFLRAPGLDTFYPIAVTAQPSAFTGDYAARRVTEIDVELATVRYVNNDYRFHSGFLRIIVPDKMNQT